MSANVPATSRETVFAIASMRTCVAILASEGISEIAEEVGGKDSVMDPIFDCTISALMGSVNGISSAVWVDSHNQS